MAAAADKACIADCEVGSAIWFSEGGGGSLRAKALAADDFAKVKMAYQVREKKMVSGELAGKWGLAKIRLTARGALLGLPALAVMKEGCPQSLASGDAGQARASTPAPWRRAALDGGPAPV